MVEGFWIVQFAGMEGKGGGVAVLTKGKVFGGDSAFTYLGAYEETEGNLKANVLVQNFDPLIGNVLGIKGDFSLKLECTPNGSDELRGQASTPAAPGFGLKVKLTRRANLV
jgi:hypothetical protein